MNEYAEAFLRKAHQSLAGADREYNAGAFDNVANRCCYAVLQAAISILVEVGDMPAAHIGETSNAAIRARFANQVIRRRKLLSADLRSIPDELADIRRSADYLWTPTGRRTARRAMNRAHLFVDALAEYLEKQT